MERIRPHVEVGSSHDAAVRRGAEVSGGPGSAMHHSASARGASHPGPNTNRDERRMETQDELDRAAGSALRELRERSGLSQEDLAIDANVDQSRLSKIERFGPSATGWRSFCRIASALGMIVEVSFRPKI